VAVSEAGGFGDEEGGSVFPARPQHALKTLAVATVALLSGCTENPANCRDEVAAAFERLRTSGRPYRRTTVIISDQRTYRESAEYIPPDRMREITDRGIPGDETSEVVRVGAQAWDRTLSTRWSWHAWKPGDVQLIYGANSLGMDFSIWPDRVVPERHVFECLGRVVFKGMAYVGYRARLPKVIVRVSTSKDPLSELNEQELMSKLQQMPQLWRTVFLDWHSALPAYDLVAEENQLDNPTSEVHFAYPGDIKIEPPDP